MAKNIVQIVRTEKKKSQSSIQDLCIIWGRKQAKNITATPPHPLHNLFKPEPSAKHNRVLFAEATQELTYEQSLFTSPQPDEKLRQKTHT